MSKLLIFSSRKVPQNQCFYSFQRNKMFRIEILNNYINTKYSKSMQSISLVFKDSELEAAYQ